MSVSTLQSSISRSKSKLIDLRKKLSKEQETETKTRKEIVKIQKELVRTKSQTLIKSKLSKLERLNKTLQMSIKEQSSLNKKITEESKKLHRLEEQLLSLEKREMKKQISSRIQAENRIEANQQSLLEELYKYKKSIEIHTENLFEQENLVAQYDVFISHASEDKEEFVRPLAERLIEEGLKVWYDEKKLTWGKPTRRSIDQGLANSRFGIVVLSEAFFNKAWTNYELNGLVARHLSGEDLILPIWHNVDYHDVMKFSPSLVDITALKSSEMTIDEIAEQLINLLKDE
ncbi:TIR domain-containing protein [Ureibacillus thermosphaericus]|uniref:TIR domain-containing protein n=2 Tax=Ureibacillus TaxID=160795 RepID=UPI0030C9B1A1